jgi:hypothetical protein
VKPQHPRRPTLRTTPDANGSSTAAHSHTGTSPAGEDGALDAIREYAQTIDAIARRLEDAIGATVADEATALPAQHAA